MGLGGACARSGGALTQWIVYACGACRGVPRRLCTTTRWAAPPRRCRQTCRSVGGWGGALNRGLCQTEGGQAAVEAAAKRRGGRGALKGRGGAYLTCGCAPSPVAACVECLTSACSDPCGRVHPPPRPAGVVYGRRPPGRAGGAARRPEAQGPAAAAGRVKQPHHGGPHAHAPRRCAWCAAGQRRQRNTVLAQVHHPPAAAAQSHSETTVPDSTPRSTGLDTCPSVLSSLRAEGGRLHQGPLAFGARLQNTFRSTLGGRRAHLRRGGSMQQDAGGMPVDVAAAAALMYAPTGCTSHATAASLAAVGGGAPREWGSCVRRCRTRWLVVRRLASHRLPCGAWCVGSFARSHHGPRAVRGRQHGGDGRPAGTPEDQVRARRGLWVGCHRVVGAPRPWGPHLAVDALCPRAGAPCL